MEHRPNQAESGIGRVVSSRLSARMTFLGIISWLSVCLLVVGLFPEMSASLGSIWMMAGLLGLASAVGLGEATKAEVNAQNDLLSNYLTEARTDALTGLGNRRAFDNNCQQWEADWRSGRTYALLLLDVDHFKSFNDRYGHHVGDEMLRAVARALQEQAAEVGTAIRYGGEEFALMLPIASLAQAVAWADTVRERIDARTISYKNRDLNVTVSIGVAISRPFDTAEDLVVRADEQLYLAKAAGRNCTRPCPQSSVDVNALLATVQPQPAFAEPG